MNLWKERWTPMLLKEQAKPFNHPDYIFEVKFDGMRAIVFANQEEVIVKNRKGENITHLYPELQQIKSLVKTNTIFDGEIIAIENGRPSFYKIQNRIHIKDKTKIKQQSDSNPLIFMCFDILYEGKNLINLPLIERKKILENIKENDAFIKVKYIEEKGIPLFQSVKEMNLEGIIAKKKDSTYQINERNDNWIKIKNLKKESFYIIGFKENKTNLSLLLGEKKKQDYYYVGKVSTPKTSELAKRITELKWIDKSFINNCNENAIFVTPKEKCQIKYLERTEDNRLRQPTLII